MCVVAEMNVKFCSLDLRAFGPGDMKVITVEIQFLQFAGQMRKIKPDVQQRAHEHVPADAAEKVEIKCFHKLSAQSELIWLAA